MKSSILSLMAGCMVLASCSGGSGDKQTMSPTFACDSARINITVVGADSTGHLDAIVSYYDDLSEIAPQALDAEGKTSIRLDLQGDAVMTLFNTNNGERYGWVRVAPGETTDITIYGNDSLVTTGRFADFNKVLSTYQPKYDMNIFQADFFRYDMNGDDYTAAILAKYGQLSSDIDADATLSEAERIIEKSALVNSLLTLASDRRFSGRCNYLTLNPGNFNIPQDSLATDMSAENYAAVIAAIDPNDETILMSGQIASSLGNVDWNAAGAEGTLLGAIANYQKAAKQAYENKLNPELFESLKAYSNPFFAEAVQNISDIAKARFEEAARLVSETPDVPGEQIIEAIAAQYPGKVVLIDRWNTWCGPCKAGIAENEPLKANVLSDPDIVWVYVADESSPIPTYYRMIPGIKGNHYRLNPDQSKAVYERYGIDGIPYYFLVDRKGNVTPRPDFRDHDLLVKTILEELKK